MKITGKIKITKKSNLPITVKVINNPKIIPAICPVGFCPHLKGTKKQRQVSPNKTTQEIIVKAFI